jgi:hypothetical protein
MGDNNNRIISSSRNYITPDEKIRIFGLQHQDALAQISPVDTTYLANAKAMPPLIFWCAAIEVLNSGTAKNTYGRRVEKLSRRLQQRFPQSSSEALGKSRSFYRASMHHSRIMHQLGCLSMWWSFFVHIEYETTHERKKYELAK